MCTIYIPVQFRNLSLLLKLNDNGMKLISLSGAFLITLALLSYGIGSISIQRFRLLTSGVLIFLTLGVILDILAITFMILGSVNNPFSLHGILGYSAVLFMMIDTILIWRSFFKNGLESTIDNKIVTYSKYAYGWWVIAYLTGSVLILWKN